MTVSGNIVVYFDNKKMWPLDKNLLVRFYKRVRRISTSTIIPIYQNADFSYSVESKGC